MNSKSVCMLTQEYKKGGTWVYCSRLAEALVKLGKWESHIICALRKGKSGQKVDEYPFNLQLVETSKSKFLYSRSYWKKSRKEVDIIKPTIVHGNMNLLASKGIKNEYPIVETIHTTFTREKRGIQGESFSSLNWVEKRLFFAFPWLKKIEKKLLQRANHLIAVSDVIKDELIQHYQIEESKITVISNGVDTTNIHYTDQKTYEKEGDDLVLGYMGRLMVAKGTRLLFPILSKVKEQVPQVKLLLAGDFSNATKKIDFLTKKYNLSKNIEVIDYIHGDSKKSSFYSSLDIFLLPSSHEAMNLTLLEALACQTPIVSTSEAVTFENDNTINICKRTVNGFAEKIIELYNNPKKIIEIRKKSKEIALRYSWKNTAIATQTIYEKILD